MPVSRSIVAASKRWDDTSDLCGQVLQHVSPQLLLFPLVLQTESLPVVLFRVGHPHLSDFVDDVEQDFFGAFIAFRAERRGVADIPPCDVGGPVVREGYAV